jgi:hypothetical protein
MADEFVLVWTPTLRELEAAIRARRRATRVTWLEWGFGGLGAVVFGSALASGTWSAGFAFVLSILWGTGLWGFGYRWLFYWRRNPHAFAELRQVVSETGVTEAQAGQVSSFEWAYWGSLLHLRHALLLTVSPKGNTGFVVLARRGLAHPNDWPALVALVTRQVSARPAGKGSESRANDG